MAWKSFTLDPDSPRQFEEVPCPDCGALLIVHAPDPSTPDRLLGVCGNCRGWYLMFCSERKLTRLPDAVDSAALRSRRKGTSSTRP